MTVIANTNYYTEVAYLNVTGVSIVHKFGSAQAVGTSLTPVTSSKTYQTPTALTSLEVVSDDNVNDVAGGSGARSITIIGLSTGWTEVEETIALNGTTAVAAANQYFRIYRAYVASSGSYATASLSSHSSTITLQTTGAGAVWATIGSEGAFGKAQTEIAVYTIPSGKKGYVLTKHIEVDGNKSMDVLMFKRENADTVAAPYSVMRIVEEDKGLTGGHNVEFQVPKLIGTGPCDVGFMAQTGVGTSDLSVEFEILLVDV